MIRGALQPRFVGGALAAMRPVRRTPNHTSNWQQRRRAALALANTNIYKKRASLFPPGEAMPPLFGPPSRCCIQPGQIKLDGSSSRNSESAPFSRVPCTRAAGTCLAPRGSADGGAVGGCAPCRLPRGPLCAAWGGLRTSSAVPAHLGQLFGPGAPARSRARCS